MHKLTRNKLLITLLTLSFLLACFTGCGEDTGEDDDEDGIGEAPPLPPDESMAVDLSEFGGDKLASPGLNAPSTQLNYLVATTTVALVSTAVVAGLAVPVALFTAAKNTTPVEQDDGSWLWSYSETVGLRTFTANLTGKTEGDKTVWSMKVSNNAILAPLDNFEWYTGTSTEDNTSGSWQFYDATTPDQANTTIAIEWEVGIGLKGVKSELTFTNNKADSPHVGDVLRYSVENEMASMSYDNADEDTTAIIEWNLETSAGSITAANGEKACWDEDKQDIECE